jgi:hypothetical protein
MTVTTFRKESASNFGPPCMCLGSLTMQNDQLIRAGCDPSPARVRSKYSLFESISENSSTKCVKHGRVSVNALSDI